MTIRSCEPSDLPAVMEIERIAYPNPWSEAQFLQELGSSYSRIDLSVLQGEIIGYICYWLAADELHILNIATSSTVRRKGVARALMNHALTLAIADHADNACLEVRTGNKGAIALYRSFGFTDDCIRKKYYSDGEDALLMSRSLKECP